MPSRKNPATSPAGTVLLEIPVAELAERPSNLRRDANGDDLVASVSVFGVLTPLNVTHDGGGYLVNAGARRLDAAIKAGLETVPCLVDTRISNGTKVAFAMLVENLQRSNLTPIEEAAGYAHLVGLGVSRQEIADQVGVPEARVGNRVALLGLPEEVQEQIHTGDLPLELAQEYTRLTDPKTMVKAARERWDSYKVRARINSEAEARVKADLANAAGLAGLNLITAHEVSQLIAGSSTQMLDPLMHKVDHDGKKVDVERWVDHTSPIELAAVAADPKVVGVTIRQVSDPGVAWSQRKWRLVLVGKAKAPKWMTDQAKAAADREERAKATGVDLASKADRDAAAKAERARLAALQDHWEAFMAAPMPATVKVKAADVTLWADHMILALIESPGWVLDKIGVDHGDLRWNSKADRLIEVWEAASPAEKNRILLLALLEMGSTCGMDDGGVDGNVHEYLAPIAEALGYRPLDAPAGDQADADDLDCDQADADDLDGDGDGDE